LLAFGDVALVAGWIYKSDGVAGLFAGKFAEQVEVAAVGSEEDVAGQGFEGAELLGEVGGHLRIRRRVDEVVAGEDVGTADDDGVQAAAAFLHWEGPGGAAFGVAGGLVGGEDCFAEGDLFAVMEGVVDLCGRELHGGVGSELEIFFAAGLDCGDVGVHDQVFCGALLLELGAAGAVVVVGVADEEGLHLMEVEAEFLDAGADLDGRGNQIAVDENVSAGSGDEVTGEVAAADVVEIAGDTEGRHGSGPVGVEAGTRGGGQDGVDCGYGCGCGEEGQDGSSAEIGVETGCRVVARRHGWAPRGSV